MGVLEGRPRLSTVRAVTPVRLQVYDAAEFLERLSADPRIALAALQRMSERLRGANERLLERSWQAEAPAVAAPPVTVQAAPPRPPAAPRVALPRVENLPATDGTRAAHGERGRSVIEFPFRVGRVPQGKHHRTARTVHLQLPDVSPYRLSRTHFALVREGGALMVRDEGSRLGTLVNGVLVGQHAARSSEPLRAGDNAVVAGGRDSPFAFRVVVAAS
jgi:hypothetical protein